jgi:recombinational DNA repair protein (RecF pathway)
LILFQFVLLREVGLRPVADRCANCKTPFSPDWRQAYFSSTANGLVCRDCEMSYPDRVRLTVAAARAWTDLKQIPHLQDKTLDEIERVLIHHLTETLGRRPRMAGHVLKG